MLDSIDKNEIGHVVWVIVHSYPAGVRFYLWWYECPKMSLDSVIKNQKTEPANIGKNHGVKWFMSLLIWSSCGLLQSLEMFI